MSTTDCENNKKDTETSVEPGESSDPDGLRKRNLSTVSKQYDIDGDGELDAVELAMRNMDKDGLGHLSNEKVYKIMRDQIEANHKLFNIKRVVVVLACLVVLLAVSNLGTAWAAFYLAKDTSVDENGTMTVKGTNTNVAVAQAQQLFELKPDASSRRMVAADCNGDGVVDPGCYSVTSLQRGFISQLDVNAIYQNVKANSVVKIQVPNKCDAALTDTFTAYDTTMTYSVSFVTIKPVTIKVLQTKSRNNPYPYFKFNCQNAGSAGNCEFTFDTGFMEACLPAA